jgi:preprotein translocase subunit SecA
MTRKLDPEERVLNELLKQVQERVEARKLKEHDDKYNYDTYSK